LPLAVQSGGLVSQEPAHGFALAARLAPGGEVGMAWHVRKGEVYRAGQRLERLGHACPLTSKRRSTRARARPRSA